MNTCMQFTQHSLPSGTQEKHLIIDGENEIGGEIVHISSVDSKFNFQSLLKMNLIESFTS